MRRAALAIITVLTVCTSDAIAGSMYWTDFLQHTVERSNLDGTNRQVVVTLDANSNPHGIALDPGNNHMYWAEYGGHRIRRANLDGSGMVTLVTELSAAENIAGLALDLVGGRMYWTEAFIGVAVIRSAKLDGSDIRDVLSTPSSRDVEIAGGRLYWTDWVGGTLESANLDGSDRRLLRADLSLPYGLEVDLINGHIFWADSASNRIRRANLDGSSAVDVLLANDPVALALDSSDGRIYWSDAGSGIDELRRAFLNGTGNEHLAFVTENSNSYDIALLLDQAAPVPEPGTLWLVLLGAVGLAVLRSNVSGRDNGS